MKKKEKQKVITLMWLQVKLRREKINKFVKYIN